jgi:hypothetical protein
MAIDFEDAKPGLTVFYQQRHMRHPEYGTIRSTNLAELPRIRDQVVRVLFLFETTAKPCHPADLHWPPDFTKIDGANPPEQRYSEEWPRYRCCESR